METLFLILAVWLLSAGVVGLFKPALVIRWGAPETRTRPKAFGLYTMLGSVCFVIFAVMAPEPQSSMPDQTPKMQSDFVASVNDFIDDYDRAANAIQVQRLEFCTNSQYKVSSLFS